MAPESVPPRTASNALPSPSDHHGFTWTHLGGTGAAAFTMGPVVTTLGGRFRQGSLFVHAPRSVDPFLCVPQLFDPAGDAPLRVDSASYALELRPRAGFTWRDVSDAAELTVERVGLD